MTTPTPDRNRELAEKLIAAVMSDCATLAAETMAVLLVQREVEIRAERDVQWRSALEAFGLMDDEIQIAAELLPEEADDA